MGQQLISTHLALHTYVHRSAQFCESGHIKVAHQAGAYSGFCSMKRQGVFPLSLVGMPVHRRVTPSSKLFSTHSYPWVKRHCESKVSCPKTQRSALARARTPTQSRIQCTNHYATMPPHIRLKPTKSSQTLIKHQGFRQFCKVADLFLFLKARDVTGFGTARRELPRDVWGHKIEHSEMLFPAYLPRNQFPR